MTGTKKPGPMQICIQNQQIFSYFYISFAKVIWNVDLLLNLKLRKAATIIYVWCKCALQEE